MAILDFESYKTTGKLKYLSGSAVKQQSNMAQEDIIDRTKKQLDSIASVMEMSTDELIGELTIRNTMATSIREIETEHVIEELAQRALAIEYVLVVAINNLDENSD